MSYRVPLSEDIDPDFVMPIRTTEGGVGLQLSRFSFSPKSLPYIMAAVVGADKIRCPVGAWGSVTWDRAVVSFPVITHYYISEC